VTVEISHEFGDVFVAKEQLGSHDIDSIFCVCQDGSCLDHFAYVAWVPNVSQHQCHIFRAECVVRFSPHPVACFDDKVRLKSVDLQGLGKAGSGGGLADPP